MAYFWWVAGKQESLGGVEKVRIYERKQWNVNQRCASNLHAVGDQVIILVRFPSIDINVVSVCDDKIHYKMKRNSELKRKEKEKMTNVNMRFRGLRNHKIQNKNRSSDRFIEEHV